MKQHPKPAPYEIGQKLRFVRSGTTYSFFRNDRDESEGIVKIQYGTIGVVTEINDGYAEHIHDFGDGPEHVDVMHGWNTVTVDGLARRAVDCDNTDWEPI